jgi:hypothetical protein
MSDTTGGLINALARPPQVNLMDDYTKAAAAANSIWANRLAQSRQAAGQAFQQSIGPDGTPDQAQLLQNLAGNPNAAMSALDTARGGQALDNATYDTTLKRYAALSANMAQLVAAYPNGVPPDQASAEVDKNLATGLITPQMAATFKSQISADPMANTRLIIGGNARVLSAHDALLASRPSVSTLNTGKTVTGVQTPPLLSGSPTPGAITTVGTPVPLTMSPGEASTPTQIGVTPQGAPISGTREQFENAAKGSQPSPLGTGRPPAGSPLLNPNAPQPGGTAAPAATPPAPAPTAAAPPAGGGVVTGIGPSQEAAQRSQGEHSSAAFQSYADDGNRAVQQNAVLGNMLADSKQFTTGPLNSRIKAFQSFATTYAPQIAAHYGLDPKTVAANESFDKLAAQLANAQGAGSDARLSVNQAANPHGEMAPESVDLVLRQLQGNADYTQAKAKLAAAYPDKSNREGFDAAIRENLDPRAFQFARMTVPQRQTYAAALSKTDRDKVRDAYNWAAIHGLIGANASQ